MKAFPPKVQQHTVGVFRGIRENPLRRAVPITNRRKLQITRNPENNQLQCKGKPSLFAPGFGPVRPATCRALRRIPRVPVTFVNFWRRKVLSLIFKN